MGRKWNLRISKHVFIHYIWHPHLISPKKMLLWEVTVARTPSGWGFHGSKMTQFLFLGSGSGSFFGGGGNSPKFISAVSRFCIYTRWWFKFFIWVLCREWLRTDAQTHVLDVRNHFWKCSLLPISKKSNGNFFEFLR